MSKITDQNICAELSSKKFQGSLADGTFALVQQQRFIELYHLEIDGEMYYLVEERQVTSDVCNSTYLYDGFTNETVLIEDHWFTDSESAHRWFCEYIMQRQLSLY